MEIAGQRALAHIGAGPFEALARDEQAELQAHGARRAYGVEPFVVMACEAVALEVTAFAVGVQTPAGEQQVVPLDDEGVEAELAGPRVHKAAAQRVVRMQAAARDIAAQGLVLVLVQLDSAVARAQRSAQVQGLAQERVRPVPLGASSCRVSTGQL